MKYLEQYIEEKLKIKVLGKLTTRESNSGEEVGVSLVIDGYEPGIEVWYADYCSWLEEKIAKGAVGSEDRVQEVTNEEGMVPVEKVKKWLNTEFYVRNTKRENSFGEVMYCNEVVSDFETMEEVFEYFQKAMEE